MWAGEALTSVLKLEHLERKRWVWLTACGSWKAWWHGRTGSGKGPLLLYTTEWACVVQDRAVHSPRHSQLLLCQLTPQDQLSYLPAALLTPGFRAIDLWGHIHTVGLQHPGKKRLYLG